MAAVPVSSFSVMPPVRGGTGLPESVMILGLVLTVRRVQVKTVSVYRERFTNRPLLPDGSSSIAVRLGSGCWMLGWIALALPAAAQDGGHLRRRCDSLFVRKVD